jgi:hypothetical protein
MRCTKIFCLFLIIFAVEIMTASCGGPPASLSAISQPQSSPASPTLTQVSSPIVPGNKIDVKEVKDKVDNQASMILIDLRPKPSYDFGHIESAISIPWDELPEKSADIPQGVEIIIYDGCT